MWERWRGDVQFFVVYIREAHAIDSLVALGGTGDDPIVEDPVTFGERRDVARVCMTKLALEPIPALVDDMDDSANEAFAAWPERLYLIDRAGEIAYRGDPGPGGFDPDGLERAIEAMFEREAAE